MSEHQYLGLSRKASGAAKRKRRRLNSGKTMAESLNQIYEANRQLKEKKGPIYERWKQGMASAIMPLRGRDAKKSTCQHDLYGFIPKHGAIARCYVCGRRRSLNKSRHCLKCGVNICADCA